MSKVEFSRAFVAEQDILAWWQVGAKIAVNGSFWLSSTLIGAIIKKCVKA